MILTAGMGWTQSEADQIRAAILALATGARVASVSYAGPPARTVSYVPAQLPELRELLAEMDADVAGPPTKTYRLATTSKGV